MKKLTARRHRAALTLGIVVALVAAHHSPQFGAAADWPQFRGPRGDGHSSETGLPAEWGPRKNISWTAPIPGDGWSSPVVAGGKVFLTSAVAVDGGRQNDRSLRTICLDAKTGKLLWNTEVFRQDHASTQRIHPKNSHASPTPVIDGKFVFVHFGTQGTACLTAGGKVVWRNRGLKYLPQHGNGGSPELAGDLLIVSCDGADVQFVVALERATGKVRWKKDRPRISRRRRFSFSTPLVFEAGGRKQVVIPGTNQVIAYNPATGNELWSVAYTGYSVIPRPVFAQGMVFVCTGWGQPSLLAIRPTGKGDVTSTHIAWQTDRYAPHTPSVLAVGDELYFVADRGIATCLDAASGKVHWQKRIGGNFSASPIYADGKIYIQSETGETTVIKPGKRYSLVAHSRLGERTLASFAVADGAIFVRGATRLYRMEKPNR